jgi:ABC-2 type transport system ATP-binding protein
LITVSNLSKSYKLGKTRIRALNEVSFSVREGEVFGFTGPNGAGKTTLMECLLGLIWPTTGSIEINGRGPTHLEVRRITGFLPERPKYDSWMNAREFVAYHYLLSGGQWSQRKKAVEAVLDMVELDDAARSRPLLTFSKGMLQRIGLAQILVGKPRLCFLDEPTSGLDPLSRNLVRDVIRKWKADNVTVILNSHNLDEVERVCDRVAFVDAGNITIVDELPSVEQAASVIVRWVGPEDASQRLTEIARQFDIELHLSETEHSSTAAPTSGSSCCRFVLRSRQQMPALARSLVNAQIDVEEIFYDRRSLERLFTKEHTSSKPSTPAETVASES